MKLSEIDTTGHGPGCPAPVGGDCDGGVPESPCERTEPPAEVWCSKCAEPTAAVVDGEALCAFHYGVEVGRREAFVAMKIASIQRRSYNEPGVSPQLAQYQAEGR